MLGQVHTMGPNETPARAGSVVEFLLRRTGFLLEVCTYDPVPAVLRLDVGALENKRARHRWWLLERDMLVTFNGPLSRAALVRLDVAACGNLCHSFWGDHQQELHGVGAGLLLRTWDRVATEVHLLALQGTAERFLVRVAVHRVAGASIDVLVLDAELISIVHRVLRRAVACQLSCLHPSLPDVDGNLALPAAALLQVSGVRVRGIDLAGEGFLEVDTDGPRPAAVADVQLRLPYHLSQLRLRQRILLLAQDVRGIVDADQVLLRLVSAVGCAVADLHAPVADREHLVVGIEPAFRAAQDLPLASRDDDPIELPGGLARRVLEIADLDLLPLRDHLLGQPDCALERRLLEIPQQLLKRLALPD